MSDETVSEPADRRWNLIRDVLVFQVKLAVDATRDLLLSPISLGAAVLDLLSGTNRKRLYFHEVLRTGRRSERWINLFGEQDSEGDGDGDPSPDRRNFDGLVGQVEALVVEQFEKGGMTAQAKDAIDRSLDRLSTPRREPPRIED